MKNYINTYDIYNQIKLVVYNQYKVFSLLMALWKNYINLRIDFVIDIYYLRSYKVVYNLTFLMICLYTKLTGYILAKTN